MADILANVLAKAAVMLLEALLARLIQAFLTSALSRPGTAAAFAA